MATSTKRTQIHFKHILCSNLFINLTYNISYLVLSLQHTLNLCFQLVADFEDHNHFRWLLSSGFFDPVAPADGKVECIKGPQVRGLV